MIKAFENIICILAIIAGSSLLTGCWEQYDEISITSDGKIAFQSKVSITEQDWSLEEIEDLSRDFMNPLIEAGWSVKKEWVSKRKPYSLLFTGIGNIHKMRSASDFYQLQKVSDSVYKIRFFPAESEGGKSSRSINFVTSLLDDDATVLRSDGTNISEIRNVLGNEWYTINLD